MVNAISDNIEENKLLNGENVESFDEEAYGKNISELDEEKAKQKNDDILRAKGLENKLQDIENLILEITGDEQIDINDLEKLGGLSKEQLEKIRENKNLIIEILGKKIDIDDLIALSKITREELEAIKKNSALISDIIGENITMTELILYKKQLIELRKHDLEIIKENKNLIMDVTGQKRIYMVQLTRLVSITKEELEKIKRDKSLILEIIGGKIIDYRALKCLSGLTKKKLEKIKQVSNCIGKSIPLFSDFSCDGIFDSYDPDFFSRGYGEYLCQLSDEAIEYCNSKNIKELWMFVLVDRIMKNSGEIKNYIKRKQEYLFERRKEDKQLINDSEFKELFGEVGKYGKGEINQKRLGYCYLYTACEILKKMNFFEILIKTNLKKSENGDGWFVKLPMGKQNGQWIPVLKNEIDQNFDIPDNDEEDGLRKGVSINSDSLLGFKIMEIAYIKKQLINSKKDIKQEFLDTGNVLLTGERLKSLEMYQTVFALNTLLGSDSIINFNNRMMTNNYYIDAVFDHFKKGLIVNLGVKDCHSKNDEIKLNRHGKISMQMIENDMIIINNDETIKTVKSGFIKNEDNVFELIEHHGKDMLDDVVEKDGAKYVVFYKHHAYSLERCYVDKNTGEKRCRIVNPWHTGIKFDISLEKAKTIFNWKVAYIDFDKLFR